MLINLRDRENRLVIKDMLDIDFDMFVESNKEKYHVYINSLYRIDDEFCSQNDAEDKMRYVAGARNHLEEELRNY